MFIDYITLMLITGVAGFLTLAGFAITGVNSEERHRWAPAFAVIGLMALATGLHMTLTWPVPIAEQNNLAWANIAFGESFVMLGALFSAAAWALARDWSLRPLGIPAFVFGLTGIFIGIAMISIGLSKAPLLAGTGFILAGLAGVLFWPVLKARRAIFLRAIQAILLVAAAGIFALIGFGAYWMHLKSYSG